MYGYRTFACAGTLVQTIISSWQPFMVSRMLVNLSRELDVRTMVTLKGCH